MKKKKHSFIITLISILLCIAFHKYDKYYVERRRIVETRDYPDIKKATPEYKGEIVSRSMSSVWKNTYLIELSSNEKFLIVGFNFLHIGDSIYKPINSDSLYVYIRKENKRYSFSIKR